VPHQASFHQVKPVGIGGQTGGEFRLDAGGLIEFDLPRIGIRPHGVAAVGDDQYLGDGGQGERSQKQEQKKSERSKRSGQAGRHGAPPWNRNP
jgi:hypothetical protein